MSYEKIKQAISQVNSAISWKSLLISYDHKHSPNEYICHSFNFGDVSLQKNIIQEMCSSFLYMVEKRCNKQIVKYTGMNPKNVVEKLSVNDEIIIENWNSLIQHISIDDDDTPLSKIDAAAFVFVGTYNDGATDKNIYLISKKNPIVNLDNMKKRHVKIPPLISKSNTVVASPVPIIQFGKCFDMIVFEDVMYSINLNFETIFNLEHSRKIICQKHLVEIAKANILLDMPSYQLYALKGHVPCKFITFNEANFKQICTSLGKMFLSKNFHIPIDEASQKFDLSDPKDAEIFTSVVCGKTKQELFGHKFCEVPSSTPLVI